MKKTTLKIVMLVVVFVLVATMAVGLAACKDNRVKIGVLVADASGAEALAFRDYYENYIQENYDVKFVYSSQLADAAAEKAAIEQFAAENCKAVISFSSYDRELQIETCTEKKLYYAIATGHLGARLTDQVELYPLYKDYEYFLGEIGPDNWQDYQQGLAMGQFYKTKGVHNIALYVGFPDPAHLARFAGIIDGLGLKYNGFVPGTFASGLEMMGVLYGRDDGTPKIDQIVTEGTDITITQVLNGAPDPTQTSLIDQMTTLLSGTKPDALLGVGMVSAFIASQLDEAGIPYSDVDAFTTVNEGHFKNGKMEYLVGKFASSIGPVFALVWNAINGNVIRNDDGEAVNLSQTFMVANSLDSFNTGFAKEQGNTRIYNKEVLDTVIGESVTYAQFKAFVEQDRTH